jgi:hypothetical protein
MEQEQVQEQEVKGQGQATTKEKREKRDKDWAKLSVKTIANLKGISDSRTLKEWLSIEITDAIKQAGISSGFDIFPYLQDLEEKRGGQNVIESFQQELGEVKDEYRDSLVALIGVYCVDTVVRVKQKIQSIPDIIRKALEEIPLLDDMYADAVGKAIDEYRDGKMTAEQFVDENLRLAGIKVERKIQERLRQKMSMGIKVTG